MWKHHHYYFEEFQVDGPARQSAMKGMKKEERGKFEILIDYKHHGNEQVTHYMGKSFQWVGTNFCNH